MCVRAQAEKEAEENIEKQLEALDMHGLLDFIKKEESKDEAESGQAGTGASLLDVPTTARFSTTSTTTSIALAPPPASH